MKTNGAQRQRAGRTADGPPLDKKTDEETSANKAARAPPGPPSQRQEQRGGGASQEEEREREESDGIQIASGERLRAASVVGFKARGGFLIWTERNLEMSRVAPADRLNCWTSDGKQS